MKHQALIKISVLGVPSCQLTSIMAPLVLLITYLSTLLAQIQTCLQDLQDPGVKLHAHSHYLMTTAIGEVR